MASAPLCTVQIMSCYEVRGAKVMLPRKMAFATPDMKAAILSIGEDVKAKGGHFALSDLFRSREMQLQAHMDYTSKKKKAYSPPPGGSMHEGGRAFDVVLDDLKMPLSEFWEIARRHGVVPIIAEPKTSLSEAWHFECRGSHQLVYDHYAAGKGRNMKPGAAMAASAILALGEKVDAFRDCDGAAVQAMLIRLGQDIGNIDGAIGPRTRTALEAMGIAGDIVQMRAQLTTELQRRYPAEYFEQTLGDTAPGDDIETKSATAPETIIISAPEAVTIPVDEAPARAPSAPPAVEKRKPLETSRSIWGAVLAVLAGIGLVIRDFAIGAWAWLESVLPFNPAWMFFGFLLLAAFLVIYARIDDRLKGRR